MYLLNMLMIMGIWNVSPVSQEVGFGVAQELGVLGEPQAQAEDPFTRLTWVREMPDGSVIVADPVERTVVRLADDLSTRTRIGRQGEGPTEYVGPTVALAMPGDSTAVFDAALGRYLVLNPEARPARSFHLRGDATIVSTQTPRAIDREGRIYLREMDGGNIMMTPGFDAGRPRLFRVDPGTGSVDPLGALSLERGEDRPVGEPVRSEHGITQALIRIPRPWGASDSWGVTADGRVARIRAGADPVLEWADGSTVALALEWQRVEPADRERYLEAWKRVESDHGEPEEFLDQVRENDLVWPDAKPPFSSIFAPTDSEGRFWLKRTDLDAERVRYALVDPDRGVVREIELPAAARLVGLGRGTVYLAWVDGFGQEWLRRHALP